MAPMKLSVSFSIAATVLIAALLCLGGFGLVRGDNRLFFSALFGAMFCSAFVYFGAFMQALRPPSRLPYGHWRSFREEAEALAVANPERPGLRKLFGWLLVLIAAVVVLRLITLLAAML
jgi:hypothetical protein